jgi:hypothetical protein
MESLVIHFFEALLIPEKGRVLPHPAASRAVILAALCRRMDAPSSINTNKATNESVVI